MKPMIGGTDIGSQVTLRGYNKDRFGSERITNPERTVKAMNFNIFARPGVIVLDARECTVDGACCRAHLGFEHPAKSITR
jgi:hypothetical protein